MLITNVRSNKFASAMLVFVVVLLLNLLFGKFPQLYEYLYLKSVFQIIRVLHDYTLGLLPVPSLYLVLPVILIWFFKRQFTGTKDVIVTLAAFLLWLINMFYILWAFNYKQIPLRQRLAYDQTQVDSSYIDRAFKEQTATLTQLAEILGDRVEAHSEFIQELRADQESILGNWDIPTLGHVQIRTIIPGSLLHFRTSGIYIPHAFEGHLDSGLYSVQWPFTMAHEMAHGYGITDESECNFVGYLTCIEHSDPLVQYSAQLAYWRYLASYYRRLHPESWSAELEALNPRIKSDLEEIRKHILKYKDWMPNYRDLIYDRYLKSHGIKAGIRSYDQMIVLIKAHNERHGTG